MIKVLIHVGYNKSATTLFQKYIYPKQKKINYINNKSNELLKELRNFIQNSNVKKNYLEKKVKYLVKLSNNVFDEKKINLISQGYFSDFFSSKEVYFLTDYESIDKDFFLKNLKKIKKVFNKKNGFDLSVFYTFREPLIMLKSYLNERSHNFEIIDKNFFKSDIFKIKKKENYNFKKVKFIKFLIAHFNIYNLDKQCRQIIGKKNVYGYFVNNKLNNESVKKFFKILNLNVQKKDFKRKVNVNKNKSLNKYTKFTFRFSFKNASNLRFNILARLIYFYKLYLWRLNKSEKFYEFLNENDKKLEKIYKKKLKYLKANKEFILH